MAIKITNYKQAPKYDFLKTKGTFFAVVIKAKEGQTKKQLIDKVDLTLRVYSPTNVGDVIYSAMIFSPESVRFENQWAAFFPHLSLNDGGNLEIAAEDFLTTNVKIEVVEDEPYLNNNGEKVVRFSVKRFHAWTKGDPIPPKDFVSEVVAGDTDDAF